MQPTNDANALFADLTVCFEFCLQCGRALCLAATHQPWLCVCGHHRRYHLPDITGRLGGVTLPMVNNHPHPCRVCDCGALNYMTVAEAAQQVIEVLEEL